jgi:hypothetical protein
MYGQPRQLLYHMHSLFVVRQYTTLCPYLACESYVALLCAEY